MLDFASYDVDPALGFLPAVDPLVDLPPAFAEWNRLSRELPYLVLTSRVRSTLKDFTTPDLSLLKSNAELERAMLIISALSMAYIWTEEPVAQVLPAALAVPWATVADRLGRPPMITHSSVVLNNWRRLDPLDSLHADNLACIQHFMGGMDEQWFFTATVALEASGAPALMPLAQAKDAVAIGNAARLTELLVQIKEVFKAVNIALLRIYESVNPLSSTIAFGHF